MSETGETPGDPASAPPAAPAAAAQADIAPDPSRDGEPPSEYSRPARREEKRDEGLVPQALGPILDEAIDRMERRAVGSEKPVPLPWANVSAALGGGLWGGTCVTLVGDTGSGKTQWALQAALHAAEAGVPVCYVAPESTLDQIAARVLALKGGQRWSDLYVGRSGKDALTDLRASHAPALKQLPFHIVGGSAVRGASPDVRRLADWMRAEYPSALAGARPVLLVLDFVQLVGAGDRDRDDVKEMMGRVAYEARQAARELDAVALLVSTTARQMRLDGDDPIGIHRDRRLPTTLGRGNPARLVRAGKETGDAERESDTVIVLAQEPWAGGERSGGRWARVWCAVAKNRAGNRAWCALRFNGSLFEEDLDASLVGTEGDAAIIEEERVARSSEED